MTAWWVIAILPAIALTMTVFNSLVWPRGRVPAAGRTGERVSVLIPARNEEANIGRAVDAALRSQAVVGVVVCDDHSTDRTAAIVEARADARVRLIRGRALPQGCVGKPHACSQLGDAAPESEVLLFVDADVELEPDGVARLLDIMDRLDADVVTAVPRQVVQSWAERLVVPLLYATYTSWLPLPLIWWSSDPRFLAANGQILAVRRQTYDRIGGFAAVRHEVVDDMAFCAHAKRSGARVVFADGHHIGVCRMYHDAGEVWRGFSKNIREGVGSTPGVLAVAAVYLAAFVAPYAALLASWWFPEALVPALVGVAFNLALRAVSAARQAQPWSGVLTHPAGVLALVAIALNSVRWFRQGTIEWRGRSYSQRETRISQLTEDGAGGSA